MKILVIKRDKIGDLLLTTPMLRHLRYALPNAGIHLLANDYNAWVVAENPDIDKLWIYDRVKVGKKIRVMAAIKQAWLELRLRFEHFDVAIVAGGDESKRAIKRALRIRAKRTIAFCAESSPLAGKLTDLSPLVPSMHEMDRMLSQLAPLGIRPPAEIIYPHFSLPGKWQDFAQEWLHENGLAPQGYIVLGLGARRAKKQPTTQQILDWSLYFKNRWGLDTVFMWTPGKSDNPLYPGDDEIAQPVLDARLPYIYPFRGALMPALGLIWSARISIFPDSGLMHFAAASPGGVLGLFAETDVSPSPVQWGPRGPRADYLEARKSVSEFGDETVFARIDKLLGDDKDLRR
ncbi:MAG: glycosyltransferase family 9 protein [Sulfuricella sp.]